MKTWLITLVVVCASLWGIAADPPRSSDHANLQGVWLAQSESQNGQKRSVTYQYIFSGDKITFIDETGKEMKYSFRLETASNLKLITLREVGSLANSTPVSVAYELDGDSLKIVVAPAGSRPTDISDRNDQELIVCRRKSP
ncbi:MAG: TIGR03067 domain-containing protein [Opitutaceae bacterium]